ncbi:MAG: S-methyl-5-thioribose-1-phosphate isomerase [Candidatus Delongbacteria bacterium]|nr:S-methyl-5-thioribose-1-phosphate isomerase [Candidatus Delongbacteria bacterium]MBN2836227.1 S-methyl-5-thioribose-1-phosphate isomerase [Candidatus Delongbacteria bacterium]
MKIQDRVQRTIWFVSKREMRTIDQRCLPFRYEEFSLDCSEKVIFAIKEMVLRGAPLIGVAGAAGVYFALLELKENNNIEQFENTIQLIKNSRPTAINLVWAVDRVLRKIENYSDDYKLEAAFNEVNIIADEDVEMCRKIGLNGLELIKEVYRKKKDTVNILTHCNAGWLATVDWGTATSPIYHAQKEGIPVHVWVDETRPRNQGGKLTAYELMEQGVSSSLITDNAGGILMQKGLVDMVIVGSDRTSINGDVANKIGTYLKALAAKDNDIPFYVALPVSTFDRAIIDGVKEIPIEERSETEVTTIDGVDEQGNIVNIKIAPDKVKVYNPGFDVTPSRLITALITDKGVIKPIKDEIERVL